MRGSAHVQRYLVPNGGASLAWRQALLSIPAQGSGHAKRAYWRTRTGAGVCLHTHLQRLAHAPLHVADGKVPHRLDAWRLQQASASLALDGRLRDGTDAEAATRRLPKACDGRRRDAAAVAYPGEAYGRVEGDLAHLLRCVRG